uniref:glycosyltransferase n=1 Tax=Thaumasiovibrio occultus TaxID=1891184 RepID=UPI000B3508C3|nr:glycosyltransferase [Thaumasiovibrio occultus]
MMTPSPQIKPQASQPIADEPVKESAQSSPQQTTSSHCIVQIVQHLRPGGIEHLCLNMVKHATVPMVIISLEGTSRAAIKAWPQLKPFAAELIFLDKQPGFDLDCVKRLRQTLNTIKPAAVHTHHIGPLLYAKLALLAKWRIAHVHTEHDAWHLQDKKQRWITRALLASRRTALVADAQAVADEVSAQLRLRCSHVILNGVDTEHFCLGDQHQARQQLGLPTHTPLIGFAGRLEAEKSADDLITALQTLPPNVHLAIAGDGSMANAWRALCTQYQLTDRVHWLGYVTDMRTFYQAIDLFCLPSSKEGLPLALLEAQACGCSVVASDVGAVSELINPEWGELFRAGDQSQLIERLSKTLAQNAASRQKSNRQYIVQRADIRQTVAAYQALALAR